MRYLILAILLVGCGPGPKSARGDDKPAAPKETYTQAVERFEKTVAGLAETQGNTNSELSAIEQRLGNVEKKLGKIESLLSLPAEISIEVPSAKPQLSDSDSSPPVKVDAPPAAASSDQRILFQGKPIDVAAWLKRSVTFIDIRGDVDAHLRDHGLEGDFSRFSRSQKLQLHSVAHSYGVPLKSSAPRKVVTKVQAFAIPQSSSNCPNCQLYQPRSRLFGWRR